jgi:endonuclease YncB( thermonuclease family)
LIEKKIEQAKRRKKGIWKNGDSIETPAEYKRKAKKVANDNKATIGYVANAY